MSFTKEAIYHKPYGKWSCQVDKDTIELVLRVKKGDVKKVYVFGGDVYTQSNEWKLYKMNIKYSDFLFDYYNVRIKPKYKRFKYYFQLESTFGEYVSYSEKELFVGNTIEFLSKVSNGAGSFVGETTFVFPYINSIDYSGAPKWVNETIWYQIFPERFAKGKNNASIRNYPKWNSITGDKLAETFMGGNIRGIINNLDYIQSVGFNGIYMTPIFKAGSIHKYDTEDYMKIDPDFGTIEDFIELTSECKKRNIRIMLDGVFNHSGKHFFPWIDVLKNKEKSKFKNWFMINDFKNLENQTWDSIKKNYSYETFAFVPSMPRLNWENKETRNYILDVVKYWTNLGVDAWRMDVAYEPSHNFWQDIKRVMRKINSESYLMGEIWTDAQSWMNGNEFDSVMNYINQDFIIKYICQKKIDYKSFESGIINSSYMYSDSIMQGIFNLLDSHDTARIIHFSNGNKKLAKIAQAILLFQTGTPSIFYGSEFLIEGGPDPDCRRCMKWDETERDINHLEFIKKLIELRKQNIEWRKGFIKLQSLENNTFLIEKKYEKEISYLLVNLDDEKVINIDKNIKNKVKNMIKNSQIIDTSHFKVGKESFVFMK